MADWVSYLRSRFPDDHVRPPFAYRDGLNDSGTYAVCGARWMSESEYGAFLECECLVMPVSWVAFLQRDGNLAFEGYLIKRNGVLTELKELYCGPLDGPEAKPTPYLIELNRILTDTPPANGQEDVSTRKCKAVCAAISSNWPRPEYVTTLLNSLETGVRRTLGGTILLDLLKNDRSLWDLEGMDNVWRALIEKPAGDNTAVNLLVELLHMH